MSASMQGDDIMLKLVHTADWHLGRKFRSFPEDGALKLSRARLEVLDRIFLIADRYAVDAVLCAGDLFDEPNPAPEWWEQTAARLRKCPGTRPVFLNTVGDIHLLPTVFEAANHFIQAPSNEAMDALLAEREMAPLFVD